ncbi:hypothetical protein HDU98_002810 [Podochytrium sp. JEL0797]|nr:hypothetical protein HDU98_002810 [Podochytrium sp. JEL0797]
MDGIMTKDLSSALTHIVYELDMKVIAAQSSQAELVKEMDRLGAELQAMSAASEASTIDPILGRMLVCRKKLLAVNAVLKIVQERLIRVGGMLEDRAVNRI